MSRDLFDQESITVENLEIIAQFRYIKIQPKTIDLSMRLVGINPTNCSYSHEPRAEVYCFRLNFNISKLGYCRSSHDVTKIQNTKLLILLICYFHDV